MDAASDGPDLDLLAASLRADAADVDGFFTVLVAKLADALPDRVQVRRGGLLGRSRARGVVVDLGEHRYEAQRDGARVSCSRRVIVRGIALRTEALELDAWLEALSADLVAAAQGSERARLALAELLT